MKIKSFLHYALSFLLLTYPSIFTLALTQNAPQNNKPNVKKVVKKKNPTAEAKPVESPTLDDRLLEQRQAIKRGDNREPSSPFLIDEVSVNGIYKSVEGYGAFLKTVNGRTFFAYSGMPLYDGSVVQIESDQVVFQQNLPGGKKKQIVKAYDPAAIRAAAQEKAEKEKKEKQKKEQPKKKTKPAEDDEEGSADDND